MLLVFFFNDTATTEIYTLSLHDALPIYAEQHSVRRVEDVGEAAGLPGADHRADGVQRVADEQAHQRTQQEHERRRPPAARSEEHTSELQSRQYLVCRLLLEKKKHQQLDS